MHGPNTFRRACRDRMRGGQGKAKVIRKGQHAGRIIDEVHLPLLGITLQLHATKGWRRVQA